jgi:hypothetical protein
MGVKFDLSHEGKDRLSVSEKKVSKRVFGPKRGEVKGGWRKLHNEFCNLY